MVELWRYGDNNPSNIPLEYGERYQMNIIGNGRRNTDSCYGFINKVRVFVPISKNLEYQSGDNVDVVINGFYNKSAKAEVVDVNGPIVEIYGSSEDHYKIAITGRGKRDLRTLVSEPHRCGGFSGMMTFIPSTKMPEHDSFSEAGDLPRVDVRLAEWKRGKNGRYIAFAEPVDDSMKRDLENEIFVGEWFGDRISTENRYPVFSDIVGKNGVPFNASGIFYIGADGRRSIITKRGKQEIPMPNNRSLSDEHAIMYYMKRFTMPNERLKLALYSDEFSRGTNKERLIGAINKSGGNIHIEELPYDFFQ